jgi:hypothetical protein
MRPTTAKPGINAPKIKMELLSFLYSTCHQLQNDVWFTVMGQKLVI